METLETMKTIKTMDKTMDNTENTAFCETCRNDVNYNITEKEMTDTLKGTTCSYTGKEARCMECGSLVFVPGINDGNLKNLYDAYRRENDIVPLEIIRAIPTKYCIGKRPLSLLLGWGEQTFSRYCDGDIPSKQYSDILYRIYHEPAFYANLLEAGRENLRSLTTYEKSRKAVCRLSDPDNRKDSGIHTVIRYLLGQCGDITPLALQKALYYIQGFYYAFYQTYLFPDNCEAWVHGPVYRDIYYKYRGYRFDPITPADFFEPSALTVSEKAVIDSVIRYLCCYSGKILEQFTHNETPWLDARGDLPVSAPSGRIISRDSIGEYFTAVKARYNMVAPSDIRTYARDMFQYI